MTLLLKDWGEVLCECPQVRAVCLRERPVSPELIFSESSSSSSYFSLGFASRWLRGFSPGPGHGKVRQSFHGLLVRARVETTFPHGRVSREEAGTGSR